MTTNTSDWQKDKTMHKDVTEAKHFTVPLLLMDEQKPDRDKLYRDHKRALSERWKSPQAQSEQKKPPQPALSGDARKDTYAQYDHSISNAWRS
jgi:hypothetical protein